MSFKTHTHIFPEKYRKRLRIMGKQVSFCSLMHHMLLMMNVTFAQRSLVVFPYITVEMELLAVLPAWRGQHAIPRLAGTAAVTHRTAKWRGR